MNDRRLHFLPLVLAVGLVCCSVGCRQATVAARDQVTTTPVRVDVLSAHQTTMPRTSTQPATVHAFYETEVFAKTAGYLSDLRVDIGSAVKAGDILAVIAIPEMDKQREAKLAVIRQLEADERRAAAQVTVAKANAVSFQAKLSKAIAESGKANAGLAAAQVELDRATDLVEQQAIATRMRYEARKKYDAAAAEKKAAEAAIGSAEAELQLAEAQRESVAADLDVTKAMTDVMRRELEALDASIRYAQLVAPFDGIVTQRNVDPGDLVRNAQAGSNRDGQPLLVIAKVDQVRVRVAVPERDVPLATVGDAAEIVLQALPDEKFAGTISRVAGVLDERTRTMLVEIDLPNPNGVLRPGMFGQATITLAPPGDTLTLPVNAVRFDEQGGSYVFLVNPSSEVEVAPIETGLDDGQDIEVTAGLTGGEKVVGPVLMRLKAGQAVVVN